MDTDWLKDFLCLAGTRSFSQAAKERGLSQPAFSRRIQALEDVPGGCRVTDRIAFEPRLAWLAPLYRVILPAMFRHRHRRLRAAFGDASSRT